MAWHGMALYDLKRGDEAQPVAWLNVIVITPATSRSRDNMPWPRHPGKLHRSTVDGRHLEKTRNPNLLHWRRRKETGSMSSSSSSWTTTLNPGPPETGAEVVPPVGCTIISTIGYFSKSGSEYGFCSVSTTRVLVVIPALMMARHHRHASQGALAAGPRND
ncbi:hypothetical protein CPLU01_01683 [Colletotrichum plurivorum]|uniref:Uncharacterized protein n=1 Tax=Colletotrichum plurivorum TaxID=2175906 RepID=A0A8H6KZ15_9PEZI|nr:hypothetical protein CPLU01_01683 [Colletotrichum plurivorum]